MTGLVIDSPVTLTQALASERIIPGDVLELADGIYNGDYIANVSIAGTEAAPVIIKPRNPGMVTIDGSLKINGAHVHIYDLNFTDRRTDRTKTTNGIYCAAVGFGLYGCVVSDMHNSGVSWFGSGTGEVCENIILNCGYKDMQGNGHAHGIYTHNNAGGARRIALNMLSDMYGDYAIQIFSGGANALRDYTVEDNVIHGDRVHTGGGLGLINFIYRRNIHYGDLDQHGRYTDVQNDTALFDANESINSIGWSLNSGVTPPWMNLTEQNNVFYGATWPTGAENRDGYTLAALPATKVWINAFSKSTRWLGNVIIYNRDSAAAVDVDLSALSLVDGDYVLRNSQNPGETWGFTYTGAAVSVPTNWTGRNKIGETWGGNTWPVFGSLVIEAA